MKKNIIIRLQSNIISNFETIEKLRKKQNTGGKFSLTIVLLEDSIKHKKQLIHDLENLCSKKR